MSWYGTHSHIPKMAIKQMLPPGSCKNCIYLFRVAIGTEPQRWFRDTNDCCPRCGINRADLLFKLHKTGIK